MKVTVYQRTPQGWILATEYYDWASQFRPQTDDENITGQVQCPGCGRSMRKQYIRFEHRCAGTLTDEPVVVAPVQWRVAQRRLQQDHLSRYQHQALHPVIVSE